MWWGCGILYKHLIYCTLAQIGPGCPSGDHFKMIHHFKQLWTWTPLSFPGAKEYQTEKSSYFSSFLCSLFSSICSLYLSKKTEGNNVRMTKVCLYVFFTTDLKKVPSCYSSLPDFVSNYNQTRLPSQSAVRYS